MKHQNSLKNGPMSRALAMEASLLLPGQDIPDDYSLGVVFCVHEGTKADHVPKYTHHTSHPFSKQNQINYHDSLS